MPLTRLQLGAIFAGGFLGAVARMAMVELIAYDVGQWPWATFVANLAGAFLLGYVATHLPLASHRRSLLGSGFCGALTTFSTMQLELLQMLDDQQFVIAIAYGAASIAAGLLAVILAGRIGGWRTAS